MPHILIVDDEPLNLELLKLQLEMGGYTVVACTDGVEALGVFVRERFDAMLLDITMPRLSGFEVCRIIRASGGEESRVPVASSRAFHTRPSRRRHGPQAQISSW